MGLCTFLSVAKEKYQKNRHLRKVPRSFPYGSYPLSGICPVTSRVAGGPQPRRSAELAGLAYSRGCATSFFFLLRVSGEMSADGAPPFVRVMWYPRPSAQSDLFAPAWAKGSRTQVVGSVREAPRGPPLRGALLVLFSRQGEKSTHIHLSDKLQFEGPNNKTRLLPDCNG